MRKNVLLKTISLVLVLVTILGTMAAYACMDIYAFVDGINERIDETVDNAVAKADALIDKGYTSDSEAIQKICEKVVEKTNDISEKAIEKADAEGYIIECEYEEVNIGGNIVLIDPLIVIGARP